MKGFSTATTKLCISAVWYGSAVFKVFKKLATRRHLPTRKFRCLAVIYVFKAFFSYDVCCLAKRQKMKVAQHFAWLCVKTFYVNVLIPKRTSSFFVKTNSWRIANQKFYVNWPLEPAAKYIIFSQFCSSGNSSDSSLRRAFWGFRRTKKRSLFLLQLLT